MSAMAAVVNIVIANFNGCIGSPEQVVNRLLAREKSGSQLEHRDDGTWVWVYNRCIFTSYIYIRMYDVPIFRYLTSKDLYI